jgi:hypothetical protein
LAHFGNASFARVSEGQKSGTKLGDALPSSRLEGSVMGDQVSIIPISDEQAKAFKAALEVLSGIGGYLKDTLGTVPEDLVGILGGDWLRVRRREHRADDRKDEGAPEGSRHREARTTEHVSGAAAFDRGCR